MSPPRDDPNKTGKTYKEPPPPSAMWNCVKSSKIRLDAGSIRNYGLSQSKKSVPVIRLWRSIKFQGTDSGGADFYTYGSFKVLLLGLEDVININPDGVSIKLAIEAERKLGCMVSERKRRFMKPAFYQHALA